MLKDYPDDAKIELRIQYRGEHYLENQLCGDFIGVTYGYNLSTITLHGGNSINNNIV